MPLDRLYITNVTTDARGRIRYAVDDAIAQLGLAPAEGQYLWAVAPDDAVATPYAIVRVRLDNHAPLIGLANNPNSTYDLLLVDFPRAVKLGAVGKNDMDKLTTALARRNLQGLLTNVNQTWGELMSTLARTIQANYNPDDAANFQINA